MEITLEKLDLKHANELYKFELENKLFYEKNWTPRPETYYIKDQFNLIMKELIKEQQQGKCFLYLIRDDTGKLVGRMNLNAQSESKGKAAELGYRMGENDIGKGIAGKAVGKILIIARENLQLEIITAGTAKDNIPSRKILEKNGFILKQITPKAFQINGKWIDDCQYEYLL